MHKKILDNFKGECVSIISLLVALLIVGFVIFVVQTAPIPVSPWVRNIINGVIVIGLLIWLLNAFGLNTGVHLRL